MRQFTVVFTPRSERQIASLYAYIAEHSGERRAEKFVGGIIAACQSLMNFPERGTKRDDIRLSLRTMGFARRATIAFSVDVAAKVVTIHGAFYGGQDFESVLRDAENDE